MTAADTFLGDQVAAAAGHANAIVGQLAAHGYTAGHIAPSPWLVEQVQRVMLVPHARRPSCRHLRGRHSMPQVVFLSIHTRELRCAACAKAKSLKAIGTVEDRRCDRCSTVIPEGQVHVLLVAFGPVMVSAGCCARCHPIVVGTG